MGRKQLSWVFVVLGAVLVVLSVLADALGIGNGDYVFGWEQKVGVAVGATVVAVSIMRMRGRLRLAERRQRDTHPEAAATRASAPESL